MLHNIDKWVLMVIVLVTVFVAGVATGQYKNAQKEHEIACNNTYVQG